MNRISILAAAVALTAGVPAAFGGWAVITLDEMPAALEAGRPVRLGFMIRQHGREPLRQLRPEVTVATAGARPVTVTAVAEGRPGHYVATLSAPDTGSAVITIDAKWREARIALLPLRVVTPGALPVATESAERGRQLFVAKGCVTCHEKRDDPVVQRRHLVDIGPELTGRTWPAEWLAAKLADPAGVRGGATGDLPMPNLGLSQPEIGALVAYVNGRTETGQAAAGR